MCKTYSLVTDDGLYDRKPFYTVKIVFYSSCNVLFRLRHDDPNWGCRQAFIDKINKKAGANADQETSDREDFINTNNGTLNQATGLLQSPFSCSHGSQKHRFPTSNIQTHRFSFVLNNKKNTVQPLVSLVLVFYICWDSVGHSGLNTRRFHYIVFWNNEQLWRWYISSSL